MSHPVSPRGSDRARKRTSDSRMRAFLAEHWGTAVGASAAVLLVGMWGYEATRDCRPQHRLVYRTRAACESDLPSRSCHAAPYARIQQSSGEIAPATIREVFVGPFAAGTVPPYSAFAAGYEPVERGGFGCSSGSGGGS